MKKIMIASCAVLGAACPAFANDGGTDVAQDGFRVEGRLMYETPTVSSVVTNDDIYKIGSAVAFGGEVGFDL